MLLSCDGQLLGSTGKMVASGLGVKFVIFFSNSGSGRDSLVFDNSSSP